ncbi:DUF2142 domain-containing protein [Methanobrevibacter boviskoreani]|uniref:DUF2142 domain-containing protein n=2 Tax=Methanobrevibacter TaxID=2172 RepID=UPI000593D454|nr:DUF2142 domain-containing protein [Methanobrevibacter boviskoreani]
MNLKIEGLKRNIINLKWFFIIYGLFLLSFIFYETKETNFNIKATLLVFLVLLIIGSFILLFITNKNLPLHKIALIIILVFGVMCVFLSPIISISDEQEHFARSEIVSHGDLNTKIYNKSLDSYNHFLTIQSVGELKVSKMGNKTVFKTKWDDQKINYTKKYVSSAFAQNPFYGYIPQAIGINIAKGLNLNNIWMLWLGRLCNLIFYAIICSYAIKKAPIYKIPLLLTACLPLSIYQAGSTSIDGMIFALALLSITYFLYLYKKEDHTVDWKNIGILTLITALCGLCKLTYAALILLIFLIPKNKFKTPKIKHLSRLCFIIVSAITLIWSRYATKMLYYSWRYGYFLRKNVNSKLQILYIVNHPINFLKILFNPMNFIKAFKSLFSFGHGTYTTIKSYFLVIALFILLLLFIFTYSPKQGLNKKDKIKLLIITLLIALGTYIVQYISWTTVGLPKIQGVQGRYFIPVIALLLIIFSFNSNNKLLKSNKFDFIKNNYNILAVTFIISFLSSLILLLFMKYY